MNPIKDVVIAGGGTAGLVTALMLKSKLPYLKIKLIKSSKEGIIGVGEGTTPEWGDFLRITNINFKELIKETGATIKIGILFNDWNHKGHQYVHSLISPVKDIAVFDYLVLHPPPKSKFPLSFYFKDTYFKNKIPIVNKDFNISSQYHFDTFKLNSFLTKKCKEKGILIKDCFIKDIKLNNKGEIKSLITDDNKEIKSEFFIDCTGFKRILISKLGAKWVSYRDKLPVSHAITFPTPLNLKKGIEPYTTATSLSSGWSWKIPTQERYGNGYVFDDRYINEDNALNELNQHLGTNIENVAKSIPFEAGKVDKYWIKNCVAIGLAGSFLEPLEAQSIGYSVKQAEILMNHLISYKISPNIINLVNEHYDSIFNNTLNMVQLHYLTKRKDSKFWKERPFNLTTWNKENLKLFSLGMLNHISNAKKYPLFTPPNFYQVLEGLQIINKVNIQQKYKSIPNSSSDLLIAERLFNEGMFEEFPGSNLKIEELLKGKGVVKINHLDYLNILKQN